MEPKQNIPFTDSLKIEVSYCWYSALVFTRNEGLDLIAEVSFNFKIQWIKTLKHFRMALHFLGSDGLFISKLYFFIGIHMPNNCLDFKDNWLSLEFLGYHSARTVEYAGRFQFLWVFQLG